MDSTHEIYTTSPFQLSALLSDVFQIQMLCCSLFGLVCERTS